MFTHKDGCTERLASTDQKVFAEELLHGKCAEMPSLQTWAAHLTLEGHTKPNLSSAEPG